MRLLFPILALLAAVTVHAVELRNELGEDQRSETIRVEIDGRAVGVLRVDGKRKRASLDLPLTGDQHRYRLSGEAVMHDGSRVAIAGGGLILRTAAMDRIGQAKDAMQAIAVYEAVLTDLHAAAPEFPIETLRIHWGSVASMSALVSAERRLRRSLPKAYRDFVLAHGSLHIGSASPPGAALLAPAAVVTLEEYALAKARDNDTDAELIEAGRRFIGKRFADARRDLVLDYWEDEYPSVLRASGRCGPGELPYAFPESQWQVLLSSHLEDNPFAAMMSYEDDIVGETQCMGFERQLALSLHDHLYEEADDVLYLLGDDEDAIGFERGDLDDSEQRLWFHFDEVDE